jgi:predicted O-linked N-acetylglucosamine transferase (SPINDLY family)
MDYLVADHTVVPPGSESYYAEKIIYLPGSYQINDARRTTGEQTLSRAQLALPPAGLVYCCFNNSYKITPSTFDSWMRILKRTDPSVLWLLEDNPAASANLQREAERRGVSAQRLLFAPRVAQSEHLARLRLAGLFLDTLPYNAHTSASDALWVGVPVLTRAGEAFASRVAASLLRAIGLPELITVTADQYEELAVALGNEPQRLVAMKEKLAAHRLTAPLFNTGLSTRNIETAYARIYERYQAELPAEHIDLQRGLIPVPAAGQVHPADNSRSRPDVD